MLCYLPTYLYASYTNRSLIQYQWIKLKLNDLIQKNYFDRLDIHGIVLHIYI